MTDGQVFREVEWTQDGETLRCVPSMMMLKRMKAAGVNTMLTARGCLNGTADALDLATCCAIMGKAAGADVMEEQAYMFLMSGRQEEVVSFQMAFVNAVMPGVDLGKKPAAPEPEPEPVKRKKTPARK